MKSSRWDDMAPGDLPQDLSRQLGPITLTALHAEVETSSGKGSEQSMDRHWGTPEINCNIYVYLNFPTETAQSFQT